MMDDVKHYAKYAGLWLTTRGIISLAVLAATMGFGVSGYAIPLITLPIGLGMATYLTFDRSSYLKTRMKNAYKLELAATLGKDPQEVTVEDLTRVAEGDKSVKLPGNAILREQLDSIDNHRTLSLLSTVGAIGIAALAFFAIITSNSTAIIDAIQNFVQPLADNLPVKDPKIFAAGMLASGISFTSDHILHHFGNHAFGLNKHTTYEAIHEMKRLQREGVEINPEQVLGVFVSRDPLLQQHIVANYGAAYDDLPLLLQTEILTGLDQRNLIINVTEKINAGKVSPNELAFLAEAQHSGRPERKEGQPLRSAAPLLPAIALAALKPANLRISEAINNAGEVINNITSHMDATEDKTPQTSFVERYAHPPRIATASYAEQVRQEAEQRALPIER